MTSLVSNLAQVRVRARIAGDDAQRNRLEAHLRRLVCNDLPAAWEYRLERALGGDTDTVYILRALTVSHALQLNTDRLDVQIADEWGINLTRGVVGRIARGEDDDLKVFPNMAAFVAHFLDLLLLGRAWRVWYCYPFAHLRGLDIPTAAHRLLMEQRESLPRILVALKEFGALDALLAQLSPDHIRDLLRHGLDAADAGRPAALRVLFEQMVALVDTLDLWAHGKPDVEARVAVFLAQSEAFVLDWRDPRSLCVILQAAFTFLLAQGDLLRATDLTSLPARLDNALSALSYLDTAPLKAAILAAFAHRNGPPVDGFWIAAVPIPERQRALIDDLVAVLRAHPFTSADWSARLLLYTALISRTPHWMNDPLVPEVIERVLQLRTLLQRGAISRPLLVQVLNGHLSVTLATISETPVTQALQFIATLGDRAQPVIEVLNATDQAPHMPPMNSISTQCAGIFLLLRPLLDLRLQGLAARCPFLPEDVRWSALLLQLGLRCAGKAAQEFAELDPGLLMFVGLDPTIEHSPSPTAHWTHASVPDLYTFWAEVTRILAGQHMLSEEPPRWCRVALYGNDEYGSLLVGEDPVSRVLVDARFADQVTDELWADDAAAQVIQNTFRELATGDTSEPQVDLLLRLCTAALLRVWSRWLRQFQATTIPYLLDNFIRRVGRMIITEDDLTIELDARPLDVVLELAGYLGDLDRVTWLGNRRVHYRIVTEW
ncbi:MAG: hypothetical protein J0M07_12890 [Anaerolineae bacterium]|nr:hypothetical protein [Anaerolineae bacterium]